MDILILAAAHLMSPVVLFGIALAAAFSGMAGNRTRGVRSVAVAICELALADRLFAALALVVQPLTGFWLAEAGGLPFATPWIAAALALYALALLCWLPAVWLRGRMLEMVVAALREETGLSPATGGISGPGRPWAGPPSPPRWRSPCSWWSDRSGETGAASVRAVLAGFRGDAKSHPSGSAAMRGREKARPRTAVTRRIFSYRAHARAGKGAPRSALPCSDWNN